MGGGTIRINRQNNSGGEGGEIDFSNGNGTTAGYVIDSFGAVVLKYCEL